MKIETRNRKAEKLETELAAAREEIKELKKELDEYRHAAVLVETYDYMRREEVKHRAIYRAVRDSKTTDGHISIHWLEWDLDRALHEANIDHSCHWSSLRSEIRNLLWLRYNITSTVETKTNGDIQYREEYFHSEDFTDYMKDWGALIEKDDRESYEAYLKKVYAWL